MRHRDAGHAFDRKHRLIAQMWKGICSTKAKSELKCQAEPLIADGLLIETLRPEIPAEALDAALRAVSWAEALRRSELVDLDWQKPSTGGASCCLTIADLSSPSWHRRRAETSRDDRRAVGRHAKQSSAGGSSPNSRPASLCSVPSISARLSAMGA